jgi:glycosyltransferase involved in cell wall biosynthesis
MPEIRAVAPITVAITAKNEAAAIGDCLRSITAAVRHAEERLSLRFRIVVVLDDCTDATESVARSFPKVAVIHSSGGLVEAQRRVANLPPFVIFSDADILVSESTITVLCETMLTTPDLQVAYPRKTPLPPLRRSLLSAALYSYNRTNGFQNARHYFNGKLFAIRDWQVPTLEELQPRIAKLPQNCFYHFESGMQIDDIYLSRDILRRYGPGAIREVADGEIFFRPPETFLGMYHTYRRMRREIERLNLLFPETVPVHQQRRYDRTAERRAPLQERLLWRWFRAWLAVCILRFHSERLYYTYLASTPGPNWPAITETKTTLCPDIVRPA